MTPLTGGRRLGEHTGQTVRVLTGCVGGGWALIALSVLSPRLAPVAVGVAIVASLLVLLGLERTGTILMVLGMLFAPLNSVRAAGFVTAADLLFMVGLALLAPSIARRRLWFSHLFLAGWLILLVVGLGASVAATSPALSINHFARFVAAALLLPLAFMAWMPRRRVLVQLSAAYLAGSAFNVFHAVLVGGVDPRPLGLTTHPNFFGLGCMLSAVLVPYLARHTQGFARLCVIGAGLVATYGVFISGSRAAFVALGATIVVYMIVERSLFVAGALMGGAALLLLFLDSVTRTSGDSNALSRLLGGGTATGSDYQRERAIDKAMELFSARPITGNGFEHAMEAHSIYLQILTSVGVVGMLGYLLILAAMALPLIDAKHRPRFQLAYPALSYAIVGVFTNSLWDRFVWAALCLSLVGAVIDNHERSRPRVHNSYQSA